MPGKPVNTAAPNERKMNFWERIYLPEVLKGLGYSFGKAATEPLLPIIAALAQLEEDEFGVYQIVFEAARQPWAESVLRSVVTPLGEPSVISTHDQRVMGYVRRIISMLDGRIVDDTRKEAA